MFRLPREETAVNVFAIALICDTRVMELPTRL